MRRLSCYSETVPIKLMRSIVSYKGINIKWGEMNLTIRPLILFTLFLLINNDKKVSVEGTGAIATFARDFIQYNVAGLPVTHQRTEWNFDPETGKKRRARYEAENGYRGELAIAKLGMGIGYVGPWGTVVERKADA